MRRAFCTPKGILKIAPPVLTALAKLCEPKLRSEEGRRSLRGPMHVDYEGQRYSGTGTVSAMNDLQFNIEKVEPIPQAVPKKAAKRATAKKSGKRK